MGRGFGEDVDRVLDAVGRDDDRVVGFGVGRFDVSVAKANDTSATTSSTKRDEGETNPSMRALTVYSATSCQSPLRTIRKMRTYPRAVANQSVARRLLKSKRTLSLPYRAAESLTAADMIASRRQRVGCESDD